MKALWVLLLCVAPASGQAVPAAAPTEWVRQKPPQTPGGREDSPSAPDRARFWDRLQAKAFDGICQGIRIPGDFDTRLGDHVGVGAKAHRKLARYADRSIALVDELRLKVSLGTTNKLLDLGRDIPLNISVEGSAEGAAYVIRPLGTGNSCKGVQEMLDLLDFKTVVPVKQERIAGMAEGELWKLPLILRATARLGAGAPLAGGASVSVSFDAGKENVASATLYRLSPTEIRLRLRIDRATIKGAGSGASFMVPAAEFFGLDGSDPNWAAEQGERLLLKEIRRYMGAALGVGRSTRDGRKVLLEFVIDPTVPEQLDALTRFVEGDLDVFAILLRIANAATNPLDPKVPQVDYLDQLEGKYSEKLGAQSRFAAADDYSRKTDSFHLRLPILFGRDSSDHRDSDRIVAMERDVELHIDRAAQASSNGLFDIPLLGQLVRDNEQQSVEAFTRVDSNGMPDEPLLVYVRQEGFMRHGERAARRMVDEVNSIMTLAGTRGEGRDPSKALPADEIQPKPEEPAWEPGEPSRPSGRTYRSAMSSFTLIFKRPAVQEILWAPAKTVFKAVVNALDDASRAVMEKVLGVSELGEDGVLRYERRTVEKALRLDPFDHEDSRGVWTLMRRVSRDAAALVKDLLEARAGDWEQRNNALVKLVSGKGESRFSYDSMMRILVQLADPAHLFGEFTFDTDKKIKGEHDVSARYRLHDHNRDENLDTAMKLKERFAEPSLLSD